MKMIDVLNLMEEGKIEKSTKLIVSTDLKDYKYEYRYSKEYHAFFDKHLNRMEDDFSLDEDFLNLEVKLIPPEPKKYQLRLYGDDDLSYVTRSSYDSDFNYDLGDEMEFCESITKFTQEEIDESMLLKFIEQHGIKEEVDET